MPEKTTYAVLTALGKDRVGIVNDITAVLEKAGCNITDSRMAILGGEFAVIMLVEGSAAALGKLSADAPALSAKLALAVSVSATTPPSPDAEGRPYLIESYSLDAPGIVHAVSAVLHGFGVNILDLDTETAAAPWSGAPMFRMRARIMVPAKVQISELRKTLAALEQERDLDIAIKPAIHLDT
jgi:glycine cleavage system transcriptional repressor